MKASARTELAGGFKQLRLRAVVLARRDFAVVIEQLGGGVKVFGKVGCKAAHVTQVHGSDGRSEFFVAHDFGAVCSCIAGISPAVGQHAL